MPTVTGYRLCPLLYISTQVVASQRSTHLSSLLLYHYYSFDISLPHTSSKMAGKVTPAAQPPSKEYMEPAHVMDFDNLNLGHPPASKHTEGMLDLFVHVFGLDEIAGSNLPISIVVCTMRLPLFLGPVDTVDSVAWLGEQGFTVGQDGERNHW